MTATTCEQGVAGIKKVSLRQATRMVADPAIDGGFGKVEEWTLDTEGVNLMQVSGFRI